MEVTNPISDQVIITTDIVINPDDLNGLYYTNILDRLKKSLLKKCIRNGYIMHIYGVKSVNRDPVIQNENLSNSSMSIKVSFVSKICLPKVGDVFYAKVLKKNEKLCQAKLGPIVIVINLMNTQLDSFENKLEIDSWIKVRAIQVIYHNNDRAINVYGSLEYICDNSEENQIKQYLDDIKLTL